MKILVTGANGQLGQTMHDVLEKNIPGISTYTDVDTLDITDAAAVADLLKKEQFTHLVNCAAYTAVDKAESDQTLCYKLNSEAVTILAKAAAENGVKVVHISTDYVFDGNSCTPYTESDKVNPTSAYGASKRKGEMSLLALCPDAVVIRTAWLYSQYGNNFVKTMLRLGRDRNELKVVYDQIGTPTFATDLANAILAVLQSPHWYPGIYHFSNEGVISWYDFTKAIHKIAGINSCKVLPIRSEEYPTPTKRPNYSVLDKTLIKKTFSIEVPYWEDSLEKCIKLLEKDN